LERAAAEPLTSCLAEQYTAVSLGRIPDYALPVIFAEPEYTTRQLALFIDHPGVQGFEASNSGLVRVTGYMIFGRISTFRLPLYQT